MPNKINQDTQVIILLVIILKYFDCLVTQNDFIRNFHLIILRRSEIYNFQLFFKILVLLLN